MSTLIAGHTFEETHVGRACVGLLPGGEVCFRKWADVRNATRVDIDKPDIAHIAKLNAAEADQIGAERLLEDVRISNATRIAAGFGIGGMAAGSEVSHEQGGTAT
jgi:hypothetical protein